MGAFFSFGALDDCLSCLYAWAGTGLDSYKLRLHRLKGEYIGKDSFLLVDKVSNANLI